MTEAGYTAEAEHSAESEHAVQGEFTAEPTLRLLFVCMGNICRSPTAEAVMRDLVAQAGLSTRIEVDSAGTGAWHAGEPADRRSAAIARAHGVELTSIARQVTPEDFEEFDYILSVDEHNLDLLRHRQPSGSHAQVRMLGDVDVPDPYYGGPSGFEDVYQLVVAQCGVLLTQLVD